MLGEEADRHGDHGEYTGRQQRSKSQQHAQEEHACQSFFFLSICGLFNGALRGASMVTEVLGRRAEIGAFGGGFPRFESRFELEIRRENAFLLIARHEGDGT